MASYQAIGGTSQETAPFTITITPRMQANLTAARQSNTNGLVNYTTGVQGASGTTVVNWDTDGDGQADASELAAGTNPLANGSVLRVTSVGSSPQGGFVLNWSGVSGRTYRVMRTQELGTENFQTLAFGVTGISPTTTFTDPNPPPLRAFYWIEVEKDLWLQIQRA